MVVDDDPHEFPLLEAAFAHLTCEVSLLTITIAHLALIEFVLCESGKKPHLALVDINMPAIDGFGLAREFIVNGLPTILMSSHVDNKRRVRAADIGVLDIIQKPGCVDGYETLARRVLELAAWT